jgi:hypothetical protein
MIPGTRLNAPYRMPQSRGTLMFMCFIDTLLMPPLATTLVWVS